MEGWIFCYLKDIVDELIMGQSPDSSSYNNEEKGIAFVQGNADMQSGVPLIRMFTTDPKRFSELNDILLSVRAPVGDVFYNNYGCLAIGRGLSAIRIKNRDLRTLVYYYLQFDKRQFESLEQGTTFTEIGKKEVRNIRIAIPQNPYEQTAIANILSKVDEAIASVQNSIAAAERLKKSLMQNLLTGKMKPDGTFRTPEEFYIDKKFGKVPVGWEVKKLKDIASIQRGKFGHRPRNDERFYNGDFPFVQTSDVVESASYLKSASQSLNELGASVSKRFPQNTIIMTIAANIGYVALTRYEVYFPDSLIGINANENIVKPTYLLFQLMGFKNVLDALATESAQKNINYSNLRSLPLLFPTNIEEQLQIAERIIKTFKVIEDNKSKIDILERLKKSLMQNLLTGKVRVIYT